MFGIECNHFKTSGHEDLNVRNNLDKSGRDTAAEMQNIIDVIEGNRCD